MINELRASLICEHDKEIKKIISECQFSEYLEGYKENNIGEAIFLTLKGSAELFIEYEEKNILIPFRLRYMLRVLFDNKFSQRVEQNS